MPPDPLARAFPSRPLRITAPFPRWKSWAVALFGVALLGGGGAVIAAQNLPALLSDHEVRARAAPYPKARVEQGNCRVRLGFLHDCRIVLALPAAPGGEPLRREISYLFVDAHAGGREVTPFADPARPDLATTDLGLERWGNRAATFAAMMAAVAALLLACLFAPFVAGRQRRLAAAMSGQRLAPVPARLRIAEGSWSVAPVGGGPTTSWDLGGKAKPFLLGGEPVAVTAPGSPLFPLDERLSWLDLSEEERAAIRAARDALERGDPAATPPRRAAA